MRGMIPCFAIVACLTLVSGAPADEQSSAHTKSFEVGENEVIYSYQSFYNDELVYLACEGSSVDKKCKVFSTSQAQTTVQSCDVNLRYSQKFYDVAIFNTGNSRTVIAVRDGDAKIKLISVNLKGCHVKETSVDVPKKLTRNAEPLIVFVAPHENGYDFVYKNKEICRSFCKATIDYEGKVVKAASEFHAKPLEQDFVQFVKANKTYLVAQYNGDAGVVSVTKDGDNEPIILYNGKDAWFGLSNAENKLGFCAYKYNRKVSCRQYDAEGKTKKIHVEIESHGYLDHLEILNLEKGFLTLMLVSGESTANIYVTHFDEQGKQVKSVRADPKCNEYLRIIPKLYKNASGQYCATSLCIPYYEKDKSKFTQTTRCFHQNELF